MKKINYCNLSKADKLLLKHGYDLNGNVLKNKPPKVKVTKLTKAQIDENHELIAERKTTAPTPPERKICEFLKSEQIHFRREYYMSGLFNPATKKMLFFDFFIPDYRLVIEYDGESHFKPIYGKDKLILTQKLDRIKNSFCKKNKIHILRISYWMRNRMERLITEKFDQIRPILVNRNSECH